MSSAVRWFRCAGDSERAALRRQQLGVNGLFMDSPATAHRTPHQPDTLLAHSVSHRSSYIKPRPNMKMDVFHNSGTI